MAYSMRVRLNDQNKSKTQVPMEEDLYKTELCRNWCNNVPCPHAKYCAFAHGFQELRPVVRSEKYRTKICKNWKIAGYCPYEHRCQFIHANKSTWLHYEVVNYLDVLTTNCFTTFWRYDVAVPGCQRPCDFNNYQSFQLVLPNGQVQMLAIPTHFIKHTDK